MCKYIRIACTQGETPETPLQNVVLVGVKQYCLCVRERLAQSGWEGSYLQILSPRCLVCFSSGRHRDIGRTGRSRRGVMGLCRDLNFSTWVAAEAMGKEGLMGRVTPKCFNSLAVRKRMAVAVGHFLGKYQVIRRCSLSERLCLPPYRCCELPGQPSGWWSETPGRTQRKFWIYLLSKLENFAYGKK